MEELREFIRARNQKQNDMKKKEKKVITEGFTEALREMKVGEKVTFPLENAPSISTIICRLKDTMWQDKPNWACTKDRENGLVTCERMA